MKKLSESSDNTVVASIRSQGTAGELNKLAAESSNIHVIEADNSNPQSLRDAAAKTAELTDDKVDVFIHVGASGGIEWASTPSGFIGREIEAEADISDAIKGNYLGPMYTFNAFLPLVRKGTEKKMIFISTAQASLPTAIAAEIDAQVSYSASKAAGNMLIAKYAVELAKDDIKTLSLAPGWVNTETVAELMKGPGIKDFFLSKLHKVNPNVEGPIEVEESIDLMLKQISNLDAKTSGAFMSEYGNDKFVGGA